MLDGRHDDPPNPQPHVATSTSTWDKYHSLVCSPMEVSSSYLPLRLLQVPAGFLRPFKVLQVVGILVLRTYSRIPDPDQTSALWLWCHVLLLLITPSPPRYLNDRRRDNQWLDTPRLDHQQRRRAIGSGVNVKDFDPKAPCSKPDEVARQQTFSFLTPKNEAPPWGACVSTIPDALHCHWKA